MSDGDRVAFAKSRVAVNDDITKKIKQESGVAGKNPGSSSNLAINSVSEKDDSGNGKNESGLNDPLKLVYHSTV